MKNWEAMGRQLLDNEDSAGKIRALSQSEEIQNVAKMVDVRAVEKAAEKGDTDTLKQILAQVLSTEDGQRLARQIGEVMGKK